MNSADKSLDSNVVVADSAAWKSDVARNVVRLADGPDADGRTTMRFALKNVDKTTAERTFEPYYSLYGARYATYLTLVQPDSAEAQAMILTQKRQQRVDETTIDSLTSFDNNNSEADKNYRYSKSAVGVFNGQGYRDGQRAADAYFQYDMIVDPKAPANHLGVRYYGGDSGRTFDVYLNDVLLKHEQITNANGATSWYIQYDRIPQAVLDGIPAKDSYKRDQSGQYVLDEKGQKIPVVTVRFRGNGTSFVGGVFGVYTSLSDRYSTDAALSALDVDGGRLAPALSAGVTEYTITVPADAKTAVLDADPATPSGLVYVDGVLIDDTEPRTVALEPGDAPTVVTLKSYAQDHVTNIAYKLTIVREWAFDVTATAAVRCAAGKATIVATVRNGSDAPADVHVDTAFGDADATVAAARSVSKSFSTRQAQITGGGVTITAEAVIGGRTVTAEATADYPATTCR